MTRRTQKKPPKKTSASKGLRIQLKGLRSRQELLAMLHLAADQLAEHGITHARGINLYLTPADSEGSPVTPKKDGRRIDQITIAEPYRSAAEEHGL